MGHEDLKKLMEGQLGQKLEISISVDRCLI
jgi:hypothetical protein